MSSLTITLDRAFGAFYPGEVVTGRATWRLNKNPGAVELRLFWYTEGKGDFDMELVDTYAFSSTSAQGEEDFSVTLPDMPYSFSGKLISIIWAIELVAQPGDHMARTEIVMSPTGREMLLSEVKNQ